MKKRNLCASLLSAIMLSGVINLAAGCMPVQELEECVSREPASSGDGAGYELIDLLNKKVWGTADFTPAEYDAFSPPLFWVKNDPRIMLADGAEFLQSPGCIEPGQFTYMRANVLGSLALSVGMICLLREFRKGPDRGGRVGGRFR